MPDVFETPVTLKHDESNCNQIIPSLKTRYNQDTPLKDSSLQKATRVIKSNLQVPRFTEKLEENDTQGWEQVERPKRRKPNTSTKPSTPSKLVEN